MAVENWSQHSQRMYDGVASGDIFSDQHGRIYHAEVETKTNAPCSPFNPVGWDAPLDTPKSYMKYIRGKRTRDASGLVQRSTYDIEIDYPTWIADWRAAGSAHQREAIKTTVQLHGSTWKAGDPIPADVTAILGDRPGGKVEAVIAASQGQPYVLGLRPFDPNNPTDVKLKAILFPAVASSEFDWMADEAPAAPEPVAPKKSSRQMPVEAGR